MTVRPTPPSADIPLEWVTILLRLEGQVQAMTVTLDRIDKKLDNLDTRVTSLERWRTEIDTRMSSVGWFGKGVTALLGGFVAVFGQAVAAKMGWL